MARSKGFSLLKQYLRVQLWLRQGCDRLSAKERKLIVYGLSLVYLISSLYMIVQFFLPIPEVEPLPIPKKPTIDTSIRPEAVDSVSKRISQITYQTISYNG